MYRKSQFWAAVMISFGIGFIISTLFASAIFQVFFGALFVALGIIIERQC